MTCANCSNRVERALRATPGVIEASVNLANERATLRYFPASVTPQALVRAVEDAGYTAQLFDREDSADTEARAREAELRARLRDTVVAAVLRNNFV